VFWIIPDRGRSERITLSVESISTIPFQAGISFVKILQWGQHSSNRAMPCLVSIFGNFWGTTAQPNENPGVLFRYPGDIVQNITNHEIPRPAMLIARNVGQVSHVIGKSANRL